MWLVCHVTICDVVMGARCNICDVAAAYETCRRASGLQYRRWRRRGGKWSSKAHNCRAAMAATAARYLSTSRTALDIGVSRHVAALYLRIKRSSRRSAAIWRHRRKRGKRRYQHRWRQTSRVSSLAALIISSSIVYALFCHHLQYIAFLPTQQQKLSMLYNMTYGDGITNAQRNSWRHMAYGRQRSYPFFISLAASSRMTNLASSAAAAYGSIIVTAWRGA